MTAPSAHRILTVLLTALAATAGCHRGRHVVGEIVDGAIGEVGGGGPRTCDPANCGACAPSCPAQLVCLSGTCSDQCPEPLRPCGGRCVDIGSDNRHCGGCGQTCPGGQGCVGGGCLAAVPVGPAPAHCSGGGPPIAFPAAAGGGCAGQFPAATFQHALCTCGDVGAPMLGSEATFDAFDSSVAPYRPGGQGGGLAANGAVNTSSLLTLTGDLRSAAPSGLNVAADVVVGQALYLAGDLRLAGRLQVAGDAHVNGSITGSADATVQGLLHTPSCASLPSTLRRGGCRETVVMVPPPCPCRPEQQVPVAGRIAHYVDPRNSDNGLIGLAADVFSQPGAPPRLDLPCGFYLLDQIHAAGPTTIVAHGNTALFIAGSIQASAPLVFAVDPDASLDVYVGGTVLATGTFAVGSPAHPSRTRFHVAGRCAGASGACRLDADCCSGVCASGACTEADGPSIAVRLSSFGRLNGGFYASSGGFVASSGLELYGSMLAGHFHSGSRVAFHHDRAVQTAGMTCLQQRAP